MKTISQRAEELALLVSPIHGTPNWDRLNAYVKQHSGGKLLSHYLNSEASDEDKHRLIDNIERIVSKGLWDETPTPPAAQADSGAPIRPPASATAKPPAPRRETAPTPAPATPPAPVATPAAEPAKPPVSPAVSAADPLKAFAEALLPYLLPAIIAKTPAAVAAPVVNEDTLRGIVRSEMAVVFGGVSKAVTNQS